MTPLRSYIRWMIRRDMAAVLEIEADSFAYPWSESDFVQSLRQRNVIGQVAIDMDTKREPVAGFMIYELLKTRINVLNIAVAGGYRRRSVGGQMIGKLISKLSCNRRARITADVRESNLPAQLFFRSCGFRCVSTDPGGYDETDESAYRFQFRRGVSAGPSRVNREQLIGD